MVLMTDRSSPDESPSEPDGSADRAADQRTEAEHRPEERIPKLDRGKLRVLNFGMSFVYWSAAVVCLLVAIAVLTNLGSGEKSDSEYLTVAGGALAFGLLLTWTGFRTYRSVADKDSDRD